jgi:hypothetical protein
MPSGPHEPRLVAYIDEAGCSGDQYGKGSSQFLVIGAVVMALADEANILQVFREARALGGREKLFRKFSECKDSDNFVLTKQLSKKPVRIVQVALHKPSMAGSCLREHHKEEYQFLIKFLLERISWIARDSAKQQFNDPKNRPELNMCKISIFRTENVSVSRIVCVFAEIKIK